jgi:hypothetical protein
MGFTSIVEAPGLGAAARRRARAAGPRAVAMRADHRRLLRSAGFRDITELDVTAAFRATAAAWLAESEAHAVELARLEPPGAFAQRQADRGPCWPRSTRGCCAVCCWSPDEHSPAKPEVDDLPGWLKQE